MRAMIFRSAVLGLCLLFLTAADAAELHVVSSGGFAAAYKTLAPIFEQKTGDKLVIGADSYTVKGVQNFRVDVVGHVRALCEQEVSN